MVEENSILKGEIENLKKRIDAEKEAFEECKLKIEVRIFYGHSFSVEEEGAIDFKGIDRIARKIGRTE